MEDFRGTARREKPDGKTNDFQQQHYITFTKFISKNPLSKRFWLENNELHKEAAAQIYSGFAERVTMPFGDFAQALSGANEKQAFGYGVYALSYPDRVTIVTSGKEKPEQSILSRSRAFFDYAHGPGVLMIDHDPSEYGHSMTPEMLVAKLAGIHSALANAARIVRGSVSAGVHKSGDAPATGKKGFHIYFCVTNAADIPRYGNALSQRLWLAEFGFIALATNGAMLERTLIDGAVFSPERLDFVGKPMWGAGLEYTQPDLTYTEGGLLDTASLHDLTRDEQAEVERLKAAAKAKIKPDAATQQTHWANKKIESMQAAGTPPEQARATVTRILSGGCKDLYEDFILEFAAGAVSVGQVLAEPKVFDGKALADPIEGSSYGKTTAKFYWNNGKAVIHSFAHGQDTHYFLHDSSQADEQDWKDELNAHVEKMNKTYARVIIGGKHRVVDTSKQAFEFIVQKELEGLYQNDLIQTGINKKNMEPVFKNKITAWAQHRKCRVYPDGVTFSAHGCKPTQLNTWRGFSVVPIEDSDSWALVRAHIEEVICGSNAGVIQFFYDLLAYWFQNPEQPGHVAIVIRGEKGSGKGTLGRFLINIWGKSHGLHISNPIHLVGTFNGHLADVCFLFADEAFYSRDKKHESVLKALITEPTRMVERKGIDAESQPNRLKIFMATNSDYAIPASRDERRYLVLDAASDRIGDSDYFNALRADIENPCVQAAFLHFVLNRDISAFRLSAIPETDALRDQRRHSLSSLGKWFLDGLERGAFIKTQEKDGEFSSWADELPASFLRDSYTYWCQVNKASEHRIESFKALGTYLTNIGFTKRRSNRYLWYLGSIDEAMEKFTAYEKL